MIVQPIIIGTAGHIDHGKTALIKALTGIDTDRLKVEKQRGITTELGFAHIELAGRRFGIIDVPGHERFIKSMVAGAGGIDVVCLVIAADEGIMPQTREHLDICELLGVRRGVVALTKRDLVDEDWLALVTEEVGTALAKTFLEDAPIIPVSAKTGDGLKALAESLGNLGHTLAARDRGGVFRLPIDRVFSIRGFGTVVTGTVLGGDIAVGDAVIAHPHGATAKIRGIEVHGEAQDRVRAGLRCALNLGGISRHELRRGDILAPDAALEPAHILDARFRYLKTSAQPIVRKQSILLHHATSQVLASLVLVDRETLAPGDEALVQLRLDATLPLAALPGDRFIARGFAVQKSYGTTIGGGEIVRVHAPKIRRSSETRAAEAQAIAEAEGDARVALEVKARGVAGIDLAALAQRLGTTVDASSRSVARLSKAGDLVRAGELLCHIEPFSHIETEAARHIAAHDSAATGRAGIPREALRARVGPSMPPKLFDLVLSELCHRDRALLDGDLVCPPPTSATTRMPALDGELAARFSAWELTPPRPKELAQALDRPATEISAALDRLLRSGTLVKVKPDYIVDASALATVREKLIAHLDASGEITPGQWKQLTGLTRKHAIPLAEHFDAEKLTLRVGDIRKRRR